MVKKSNAIATTIKTLLEKGMRPIEIARKLHTTSSMSSRKIASLMNEEFKRDNINITISKDSVNRYLKAEFGKPRKIRKVFHLTNKQKKERVEFCESMLEKDISGIQIMFTDETQIKTGSFIKDSIRLSPENKEKLKTGKKRGL